MLRVAADRSAADATVDQEHPDLLRPQRLLRTAGLSDVRAEAYFPVTGPACDALEYATVEQVRDRLVDAGLATRDEIDEHLANVAAGRLDLAMAPMITAWGRRA